MLNYDEIINSTRLPKHIAITVVSSGNESAKTVLNARKLITKGITLNIPMITLHFPNSENVNSLTDFFNMLQTWNFIGENQIKISVLGKWYNLPERLVEAIKSVLEKTKDYDRFFLNFCINYDGQEEIVDACKLIAKQVQLQKLDPEQINKSMIKEDLYSSYFLPPDLIIKTGFDKKTGDLMLWDSAHSKIFFAEKYWEEFTEEDFVKAVRFFSE